jgi:hypothetical protein
MSNKQLEPEFTIKTSPQPALLNTRAMIALKSPHDRKRLIENHPLSSGPIDINGDLRLVAHCDIL